ncbi:MAG: DUF6384 family protein [Labrys sp. (in: a-proteobacteria)]
MTMTDAGSAAAPKLDELMLAMDVVDTLRHQEAVVEKELGQDDRDEALKARLRTIYEGQGLVVTDRILDAGIKALKEARFTYERRGSGFNRFLAGLWVRRARVGYALAVALLVGGGFLGFSLWQSGQAARQAEAMRIELAETLPRDLATAGKAALAEARDNGARQAVENLVADAEAALGRGDAAAARQKIGDLTGLREKIVETYDLRVVNRSGVQSGVFRIPDVNSNARNYYLIVEPVKPNGEVIAVNVTNEETGAIESARIFGVRVPKEEFDRVRADKLDDGIIQSNILGQKPRGSLDIAFSRPVLPGRITKW